MKPLLSDYRLYLVTDSRLHKGYSVLEQVRLALQGGIRIIQLAGKRDCLKGILSDWLRKP